VAERGYAGAVRALPISRRRPAGLRTLVGAVTRSDTGRAAGLGAAAIGQNVLALAFTIVFARLLGASGYGSLAVLMSAFIILMVPGSALQIAVAREVSRDVAADARHAGAGIRRWLARLALGTLVVGLAAIPLRSTIGALINVDDLWAAAAVPVTAMLWVILCVERGALQGFQRYRPVALSIVGDACTRIVFALLLFAIGLDVTGAFLGAALAFVAMSLALLVPLHGELPLRELEDHHEARLRDLLTAARAPVIALTLLLALQELHVIIVKHEASGDAAGSYAVAAVAAKAIIWIAVGLGMYLVPEAARRAKRGEDARPVLVRMLGLIAAAGIPMVLVYAVAGRPLLESVFGEDLILASDALPWLGLAMVLLACSYLSVQYLLALGRWRFTLLLAAAVVVEVVALIAIGADLTAVALALVGLQAVCAATLLFLALRTARQGQTLGRPEPARALMLPE
jgi:O-antigen/teichoic acid export membrane protein